MSSQLLEKYEIVVGLEVHAQLSTKSKAFCSDATEYGAAPNTQISPLTLGLPGTLPQYNKKALEDAVKMGLACNSEITELNIFARKNYFYADLPKGYQITQDKTPLCVGGYIEIEENHLPKKINITRIHIEEDAGKSIHDLDPYYSLIDLNRAGVPLIEIVSEPDIRSSEEAYKYLTEIRKLVRYLEICDGNMEEGSLRCDANISVRIKGNKDYGNRVEVKNMNSIRNVKRAIEYEALRQMEIVEQGGIIEQHTRSFDAVSGTTFSMRSKEMAHDYRYFPEPDLPPLLVGQKYVDEVKQKMPALPKQLIHQFQTEFGLSEYDAKVLTDDRDVSTYFLALTQHTKNYKSAANWLMVNIKSYLNENSLDINQFPLFPEKIAQLIELIDTGKVSHSAAQKIFLILLESPNRIPIEVAENRNLIQQSDNAVIASFIDLALQKYPEKITEYKNGKKGLIGLFMGEVMKQSKGKLDPKITTHLLTEKLDNY